VGIKKKLKMENKMRRDHLENIQENNIKMELSLDRIFTIT
jgi:hypothetical protein